MNESATNDPHDGYYFDGRSWHPRKQRKVISESEWWARAHLFLMDLADAIGSATR